MLRTLNTNCRRNKQHDINNQKIKFFIDFLKNLYNLHINFIIILKHSV